MYGPTFSGCWFQPIWKILVKLEIFPNFRGEQKKYLKPPPNPFFWACSSQPLNLYYVSLSLGPTNHDVQRCRRASLKCWSPRNVSPLKLVKEKSWTDAVAIFVRRQQKPAEEQKNTHSEAPLQSLDPTQSKKSDECFENFAVLKNMET